ncbi:hypothetical protein K7X08_024432 [Anisodus acutangulus]|uniref:Uncharacterized protein n=1 Tax=Anisodus acutangulus TaxID=402998 RepID=A0A9Q1MAU3_9SOLA|nr:hypothetical protein K7X08_024432 [Anisodus acutangulus]
MYSICGYPSNSRSVFDQLKSKNLYQWNALMSGYTKNELWFDVICLFIEMMSSTHDRPDSFTFPCVIKACGGIDVGLGEVLHGMVLKMGLLMDVFVSNSLISMYGKFGLVEEALKVFEHMPERNLVSWNSMISGFSTNGNIEQSFDLFRNMFTGDEVLVPDTTTMVIMLPICAAEEEVEVGKIIHGLTVKLGLVNELTVNNSLVDMYCKVGYFADAQILFEKNEGKNVVSWNSIIGGYSGEGDVRGTFHLMRRMQSTREYVKANEVTLLNVLPVCLVESDQLIVKELHGYSLRKGLEYHELLTNAFTAAYAKCGLLRYSELIFYGIVNKTVSSWNALLSGYAQNENPSKAFTLSTEMMDSGLLPDWFTIGSLLFACSNLKLLRHGTQIHCFVLRNGLETDMSTRISLVSFYMNCGKPELAQLLFDMIEDRNIVSWNVMIAGFLQNALPDKALCLFRDMHHLAEARIQKQPANSTIKEAAKPDDLSAKLRPVIKVVEPPEVEQYTVRFPEGITSEEVNIIKLTAQFVARNGKSFLTGLTNREINNPLFYFLNPNSHSNAFMFFASIVDVYSEVLMPRKNMTDEFRKSFVDMTTVLERCLHGWNGRDFADDEDRDLPRPMTVDEVIRRSKMPTSSEQEDYVEPVEMKMDDEEMQLVEEGIMEIPEEWDPLMRIVKDWKRPEERIGAGRDLIKYVVSPISDELIPVNEMSEHMRISLIDPKYKEQKERMFAKIRETTLAQDDEIFRSIVGLARTLSNAVKAEIEKKKEEPKQVIWDGHTGSIGRTANQAMSQNTNTDDQNAAINLPGPQAPSSLKPSIPSVRTPTPPMPLMPGQQTLVVIHPPMPPSMAMSSHNLPVPPPPGSEFTPLVAPRPFVPLPMSQLRVPMVPPPPMPQGMPPLPPEEEAPLPEETELKRQKLDESVLIPEEQFLAQHSGPARINVSVATTDEGNLKGQVLEITVESLSEIIGSLKGKISGEIQLPANKQKLSGKAGFLKDNLSLAYYNVASGETLALSLRERGGRKR